MREHRSRGYKAALDNRRSLNFFYSLLFVLDILKSDTLLFLLNLYFVINLVSKFYVRLTIAVGNYVSGIDRLATIIWDFWMIFT